MGAGAERVDHRAKRNRRFLVRGQFAQDGRELMMAMKPLEPMVAVLAGLAGSRLGCGSGCGRICRRDRRIVRLHASPLPGWGYWKPYQHPLFSHGLRGFSIIPI